MDSSMVSAQLASPVSNDGRGLKPEQRRDNQRRADASPVSNDGRGLKLINGQDLRACNRLRPSAMTGVD